MLSNKILCFVMTIILCLAFCGEIVLATEKSVDYEAISAQIARDVEKIIFWEWLYVSWIRMELYLKKHMEIVSV